MDKYETLVEKVKKMRFYQKEFFKNRSSQDLQTAKKLEKEVDNLLIDESKQKELFDA